MKNNQSERIVTTNGTPDLSLMPIEVLETIAVSLEINIAHSVHEGDEE